MALCAALALTACGSTSGDPSAPTAATDPPKPNAADRAFVAEMLPHHESGVAMAEVAQKRGRSRFVRTLSANIIRSQSAEIETLQAKAQQLGVSAHHAMDTHGDADALKTADPFDAAFLNAMIPHHQDAVEMAETELDDGSDQEIKSLALQILTAQQDEIRSMRRQLRR